MNDENPSPGAKADGDQPGAEHSQDKPEKRPVKAARVARTAASQRLKNKESTANRGGDWGSWIRKLLGGDNQLYNIMSVAIVLLLVILIIAIIGAILLGKEDFFIETAKPVIALIATIIAFIAGQKSGPRS